MCVQVDTDVDSRRRSRCWMNPDLAWPFRSDHIPNRRSSWPPGTRVALPIMRLMRLMRLVLSMLGLLC